jgi:chloramphenicol-sensitive protein RarD
VSRTETGAARPAELPSQHRRAGVWQAATAYISWGLFPLYFLHLTSVPAPELVAHRVVWALLFLLGLLAWRRQWTWIGDVIHQPRVLLAFGASALLLAGNWGIYIWAVMNGHVIESSLGYFITPLVNVLLGYTVLHERPRRAQWVALSLAALGVLWLTLLGGKLPWIALVLAASFGTYGLLRKVASLGALEGLALETMLLAPLALAALAYWWMQGQARFGAGDWQTDLWLIGVGPITAIPLLLFAAGARRITMTTLGLLQYLGPTIQFMLGLWLFREPFDSQRLLGFGLIWTALLVYSLDGWRQSRDGPRIAVEN